MLLVCSVNTQEDQFSIVLLILFALSTLFLLLTINFLGEEIDLFVVTILYAIILCILIVASFLKS